MRARRSCCPLARGRCVDCLGPPSRRVYGDGPDFHFDYYNSFVIQPMLIDIYDAAASEESEWAAMAPAAARRSARFAEVQERMIAPDGSFPPLGRSLAYR